MIDRLHGIGLLVLAISFLVPLPGGAQTDATTLPEIEELAQNGRSDEARAALLGWWEESRVLASREERQFALWLRGRLTVDPSQAVRDFRRLVVEYPGGPFTARALYRLARRLMKEGPRPISNGIWRPYLGLTRGRRCWLKPRHGSVEPRG